MTERKPLTSTTWAHLARTGLRPNIVGDDGRILYWDSIADLGHELVALSATAKELGDWKRAIDPKTARSLVSACYSGYPVMLTWDTRMAEHVFGEKFIERKQTAVIVEQIFPPSGDQPGRMRIRYCGFGHPVYLHEVVEAHVFDTVVTWHSPEEN